jgi:hypothetical protein
MVIEEVLRATGQVGADGRVAFRLARPDGSMTDLAVAAGPSQPRPVMTTAADAIGAPAPLFRKQPNRFYWYEYLPDRKALFIQYNRCANDPARPFSDFARDLFAFADAHPIERVIVDLRFNSGGDSRVIEPLIHGLRARGSLRERGRLFALIGRATFSSGLLAAIQFRNDLKAVLVGEPVGEKPNSYGEVRSIVLPHSRVTVQYSIKFFRMVKGSDPPAYEPDVRVGRTIADALAGRDPVLDAALAFAGH